MSLQERSTRWTGAVGVAVVAHVAAAALTISTPR
jgi:hypothetical protein